ncbi:MAG: SDR family NAD(P)-dependent oxidoreductase [Patescibacteria group bacterium]
MIIITGASDGLGLQLTKLYKESGKTVVNISRRKSEFASLNLLCDLANESEIKKTVQEILKIDEKIEALINCAAVMSVQKLGEITGAEFDRLMSVNVKAAILLVSNLIERIKTDEADIVNVASTVGFKGYTDQAIYGASKWAMRGFSANLQLELKGTKSRVISFCPGGFKTKLFAKATGVDNTGDGSGWMKAEDVALALKQTLDLPKNMEVSEVIINRK